MQASHRASALAALVLITALAGCIGSDDGEAIDAGSLTDETLATGIDATLADATDPLGGELPGELPTWTHGDWWTYDITFDTGFGTFLDGETTVIVFGTGGQYALAAADRPAAIVDAHFDMFLVGDVGLDLNPQGPFSFQMFDFPLEDGKSWDTQVPTFTSGGVPVTLTVADLGNGEFQITGGSEDGAVGLDYTYSAESNWLTSYTQQALDFNGNPFTWLDMQLRGSGANYEGSFVVLTKTDLYERFIVPIAPDPQLQPIPPADTVNIGDGFTFLQRFVGIFPFGLDGVPTAMASVIAITDPNHVIETFQSTGDFVVDNAYLEPVVPGDYRVVYAGHGTYASFVGIWGFAEEVIVFDADSHAHHQ